MLVHLISRIFVRMQLHCKLVICLLDCRLQQPSLLSTKPSLGNAASFNICDTCDASFSTPNTCRYANQSAWQVNCKIDVITATSSHLIQVFLLRHAILGSEAFHGRPHCTETTQQLAACAQTALCRIPATCFRIAAKSSLVPDEKQCNSPMPSR